jgi:hypothetical protein
MPKLSSNKNMKRVNKSKSKSKQLGFKKEKKKKSKRLNRNRNRNRNKKNEKRSNKKKMKGGQIGSPPGTPETRRKFNSSAPTNEAGRGWRGPLNFGSKCLTAACRAISSAIYGTEEYKIKQSTFYDLLLTQGQKEQLHDDFVNMEGHGLKYMDFFEMLDKIETKLESPHAKDFRTVEHLHHEPNFVFIVKDGFEKRAYELDIRKFHVENTPDWHPETGERRRTFQLFFDKEAAGPALSNMTNGLRILYGSDRGTTRRRITTTEITTSGPAWPELHQEVVFKKLNTLFKDQDITTCYIEKRQEDIETENAFKVRVAIINWLATHGNNFFNVVKNHNPYLTAALSYIDSQQEHDRVVAESKRVSDRVTVGNALRTIGRIKIGPKDGILIAPYSHSTPMVNLLYNNRQVNNEAIRQIWDTTIGNLFFVENRMENDEFAKKIIQSLWNKEKRTYSNVEHLEGLIAQFENEDIDLDKLIKKL